MLNKKLPADWQEWIADCLMMQVEPAAIIEYMVSRAINKTLVEKEIAAAESHPYVLAGAKMARRMKRRDWLLRLQQSLWKQSPYLQTIERRDAISKEEFYKHYHCVNRPVILTGVMKDWHIYKNWSPAYFKQHFGERRIQVVRMDENFKKTHVELPMSEYVDTITSLEASNEWYMTNSNTPYNNDVIGDLYGEADRYTELLNPEGENPNGNVLFGPNGTRTDLHFDLANALYCQVYGTKHFKIIAPHDLPYVYPYRNFLSLVDMDAVDLEKFPLFKEATVFEFDLNAGEMLFLPIGWWHYVVSKSVSISLSFSNFYTNERYHQYFDLYGRHPKIND